MGKLILVTLALGLSACAPSAVLLKQKYEEGYNAAAAECVRDSAAILRELGEKNERLRKFNQIDSRGKLRTANPCFDNPSDPRCAETPTGKESWQK